ncbi:hypothetical protein MTO96_048400, partial [Rhipicephalus appendiculatus]
GYNPADANKGGQPRAQRSVFKFHVREKRWDKAADMLQAQGLSRSHCCSREDHGGRRKGRQRR